MVLGPMKEKRSHCYLICTAYHPYIQEKESREKVVDSMVADIGISYTSVI
jgi:hypothetical protein